MIYDDIKVCNRALTLLKQNHINSLDDNTFESRQCKFLYELIKAEVLSSNIWKACLRVRILNNSYNKNKILKTNYKQEFMLPSDCLRILEVNKNNDYLRQGRYLYTDSDEVELSYIADMPIADLPLNLVYLVILRLAMELSFGLNDDKSLYENLRYQYDIESKKSANTDTKEGREVFDNNISFESSWINSRY